MKQQQQKQQQKEQRSDMRSTYGSIHENTPSQDNDRQACSSTQVSKFPGIQKSAASDKLSRQQSLFRSDPYLNSNRLDGDEVDWTPSFTWSPRVAASSTEVVVVATRKKRKFTYFVEPMAFLQWLATTAIMITINQFIYHRFLDRLTKQASANGGTSGNVGSFGHLYHYQQYDALFHAPAHFFDLSSTNHTNPAHYNCPTPPSNSSLPALNASAWSSSYANSSQADIILKAQQMTSSLNFYCSLFSSIPTIIMTVFFSVNCSNLGRKTLLITYSGATTIRLAIIFCQCLFPDWPDWVFFLTSMIDGFSGGVSTFFMGLYCYLADTVSLEDRSFRITLINIIGSVSTLTVTLPAGYLIQYYGYMYVFLASVVLSASALLYGICAVPESLAQLRNKSVWERLSSCSVRNVINCVTVFFTDYQIPQATAAGCDESDALLTQPAVTVKKQSFVLLLIVAANVLFSFVINGASIVSSIFQLFVMNYPFCFDSVGLSYFTTFATIASIVACFVVSKLLRVNDLIVATLAICSLLGSYLCYIFGKTTSLIYAGAAISSISTLEFSYVKSAISKNMHPSEIADAFSLITISDTIVSLISTTLGSKIYEMTVSTSPTFVFVVYGIVLAVAILFLIISFCFYKSPLKQNYKVIESDAIEDTIQPIKGDKRPKFGRYLSASEGDLSSLINSTNAVNTKIISGQSIVSINEINC